MLYCSWAEAEEFSIYQSFGDGGIPIQRCEKGGKEKKIYLKFQFILSVLKHIISEHMSGFLQPVL